MDKKSNLTVLQEITDRLPDFCTGFLYEGQSEHSILTKLNYARDIEFFLKWLTSYTPDFSDVSVKDISVSLLGKVSTGDINRYLNWFSDRDYSDRTKARRKSSISALFKYLVYTERKLSFNPVLGANKVVPEQNNFIIYLTREEQDKLTNCIKYGTGLSESSKKMLHNYSKRDLAIITLFLDTGLRISELQQIDIKDLDFYEHVVYVRRKGRKNSVHEIYFSDEAEECIKAYLESRDYLDDEPLFISNRGTRIAIRTIETMLDKYVKAALPGKHISPHKLRSTFAMEFYKACDNDILLLQQRMGHRSIAATNIYARACDNEQIKNSRNWR